ncbi:MAG: hypothetical protein JJT95_17735 [Pararhodobacter sp.]|nr:hypothetical protein [Pararhodobacter sp.]
MTPTARMKTVSLPRIATLAALPLALLPMAAGAEEVPGADFAFELIDPGFCMMPPPDFTDANLRAIVDEQGDDIPVVGEIDVPVGGRLYGDGFFARGAGRNAIAATMHLMAIPEEGRISAVCLALVPVNDMNATEGVANLYGPESAPDEGDYYMVFARVISRTDGGEEIHLGELGSGDGFIEFTSDGGDTITGEFALRGALNDSDDLHIDFEFEIHEEDALRFVDLSSR